MVTELLRQEREGQGGSILPSDEEVWEILTISTPNCSLSPEYQSLVLCVAFAC